MKYVYFVSYMYVIRGTSGMGFGHSSEVQTTEKVTTGEQVRALSEAIYEANAVNWANRPTILNFQLLRVEDAS